jgi:hypothetical protein
MKVYVGKYEDRPRGVEELPQELRVLHPNEFDKHLDEFPEQFWTNNPYLVDICKPENVFCCFGNKVRPLNEHSEFNIWKNEYSSGELWSMFGENWI